MPSGAEDGPDGLAARFRAAPPEHRPDMLREMTDPVAARHFAAQRHAPTWQPRFDVAIPELASAALLLMVKDEADIIRQNLDHHYRLGFRRFFILDNASTDDTADRIAAFRAAHADALVFCAYDPIVGYYQQTKTNALQSFAEAYLAHEPTRLDWIFFVDADEFITCCTADAGPSCDAFRASLADPRRMVMIFHWVQCASAQPYRSLSDGYAVEHVFDRRWRKLEPAVPKIAFRAHRGLATTQGNHTTSSCPYEADQVAVMAEAGFYLLHYPMRSMDQLRRKITNGGRAYAGIEALAPYGGHWKQYDAWLQQHGDGVLLKLLNEHIASCA